MQLEIIYIISLLYIGPISGYLLTKMEARTAMCLGLFLSMVGYVAAGYATSVPVFFLVFAILGKYYSFTTVKPLFFNY